jgi:hypothetical protein
MKESSPVSEETKTALLRTIIGARLTSVQFIMDYLILGFDAKGALTTVVWPELDYNKMTWRVGMDGYRDKLCDSITHSVENVQITASETMVIDLANGLQMRIQLRSYNLPGERAIFSGPKHVLCVW